MIKLQEFIIKSLKTNGSSSDWFLLWAQGTQGCHPDDLQDRPREGEEERPSDSLTSRSTWGRDQLLQPARWWRPLPKNCEFRTVLRLVPLRRQVVLGRQELDLVRPHCLQGRWDRARRGWLPRDLREDQWSLHNTQDFSQVSRHKTRNLRCDPKLSLESTLTRSTAKCHTGRKHLISTRSGPYALHLVPSYEPTLIY